MYCVNLHIFAEKCVFVTSSLSRDLHLEYSSFSTVEPRDLFLFWNQFYGRLDMVLKIHFYILIVKQKMDIEDYRKNWKIVEIIFQLVEIVEFILQTSQKLKVLKSQKLGLSRKCSKCVAGPIFEWELVWVVFFPKTTTSWLHISHNGTTMIESGSQKCHFPNFSFKRVTRKAKCQLAVWCRRQRWLVYA